MLEYLAYAKDFDAAMKLKIVSKSPLSCQCHWTLSLVNDSIKRVYKKKNEFVLFLKKKYIGGAKFKITMKRNQKWFFYDVLCT